MSTETEQPNNIPEQETPPSHNMEGKYVVLLETSAEEHEQWYYFIKYDGNEEALKHLQDQLEQVEWTIEEEGNNTFDLDLEHFVSATTAKEMTKVDLNAHSFNRKFDGTLQKIDLKFKKKYNDDKKMAKAMEILGDGQIENFIDDEDIDPEDLCSHSSSDENDTDNESVSSDDEDEDGSPDKPPPPPEKKPREKGIPKALLECDRPGWARAKGKKTRK
tara:strand:- start:215 stop:868 length:654 start_codon:yes stop_codon:yes gene_type:complete